MKKCWTGTVETISSCCMVQLAFCSLLFQTVTGSVACLLLSMCLCVPYCCLNNISTSHLSVFPSGSWSLSYSFILHVCDSCKYFHIFPGELQFLHVLYVKFVFFLRLNREGKRLYVGHQKMSYLHRKTRFMT